MKNKHTQGPWFTGKPTFGRYNIYSDHTVNGKACMSGRQAICAAPYEGKKGSTAYHEMFIANARLIAAAPDMLQVLQELEESSEYWSEYFVPLGIVERIHAAIAKATGPKEPAP